MTSTPGRKSIRIAPDWQKKGELLMAGLVEEINGLWHATSRVEGHPTSGGQLEIENLNQVLNWLRRALTTIRSLDVEVFTESDKANYEAIRESHARGLAVRGLVGPRNNAVHHPEVVDPDVARAVGPLDDGMFAIFPRWKVRDVTLDAMFSFRGKFRQSYADAYDQALAGRPLLDPLLDAFAFFDLLAPSLAERDPSGALVGFPVAPSPDVFGYRRLHPDWPSEVEQNALLHQHLVDAVPTGTERRVVAAVEVDGEIVLGGYTEIEGAPRLRFVEPVLQVRRDIGRGYRYLVVTDQWPDGGEIATDMTLTDGSPFPQKDLLDAGAGDRAVWEGLWTLCRDDAAYYRGLRMPPADTPAAGADEAAPALVEDPESSSGTSKDQKQ